MDAPIDMKIKSAMISDLLTVVGVPAIDPVLKRAQFNQKINSLTQVGYIDPGLVIILKGSN